MHFLDTNDLTTYNTSHFNPSLIHSNKTCQNFANANVMAITRQVWNGPNVFKLSGAENA
jgi:hypothetical protein